MADLYGWLPPQLNNDFIKAGHNNFLSKVVGKFKDVAKKSVPGRPFKDDDKGPSRRPGGKYDPVEHPVRAARDAQRGKVRAARDLGRAGVLTARATGGDVAAAREARKSGVATAKQTRRDVIGAAQSDPNAAGMEKYARGQARRSSRAGRVEARASKLAEKAKRLRGGMVVKS